MKKLLMFILITSCFMLACAETESTKSDGDFDSDTENQTDGDSSDGDTDSLIDGDDDIAELELEAEFEARMEQHGRYSVVWLKGTPYEMGFQQGTLLKDSIKDAMDFVAQDPILSIFPELAESLGVLDLAHSNSYKDVIDECQGLVDASDGTGLTLDYCLLLNFGDVLVERVPFKSTAPAEVGPGCTSVIVNGDATSDGGFYHARNLDWGSMDISVIHEHPVIFIKQPKGEIAHAIIGFPLNICPYTGMNAEGLTFTSHEADPFDKTEMDDTGHSHVQMMGRLIKTASTLNEAKTFLENEDHMGAEMIVIADAKSNDAAVFEMTAKHMEYRSLDSGYLYTTNHFEHPSMVDHDLVQDPDAVQAGTKKDSSLMRWWRLNQLIDPDGAETKYGQLDPETLITVMRDRKNPVTAIVAPFDDESVDNDAGIATNGPMHMVLFDPAKLLFYVAAGHVPIPKLAYECFSLGEMLGLANATPCSPEKYE